MSWKHSIKAQLTHCWALSQRKATLYTPNILHVTFLQHPKYSAFSLGLQTESHMNAPWTHTYFGAILSSYGTPLPSLSSCIPCEYLSGIIKWSNPQEVREVWHGVIAKWQTFDSSEKNEITSLTSWEITPSLDHTHTHTHPILIPHPLSVSVTAQMDTEKNHGEINIWILK